MTNTLITKSKILEFEKKFLENPNDNVYVNRNYLNTDENLKNKLFEFFNYKRKENQNQNFKILNSLIEKYVKLLKIIKLDDSILKKLKIKSKYFENKLKIQVIKFIRENWNTQDFKAKIKYEIYNEAKLVNWSEEEIIKMIEIEINGFNKYIEVLKDNKILIG